MDSMKFTNDRDVSLVPFGDEFLDLTFGWINDPRVAGPFLINRKISSEEHRRWYRQMQDDSTQFIFAVLDQNQQHVGNLGFKFLDQDEPEMWMYIDPERHGEGLGRRAAIEGVKAGLHGFNREALLVRLATDNIAARNVYAGAGFEVVADDASQRDTQSELIFMRRQRRATAGQGLRVAMMQPMFIPWLGLFELIDAVDVFVFLDDFQFSRQGWGQRNRLFLSPGRPGYLSLPISHPHSLTTTFQDIKTSCDPRWLRKTKSMLQQTYGRSDYFADGFALVEPYLDDFAKGEKSLADIEISLTKSIASYIGVGAKYHLSSEFDTSSLNRSNRVLALIEAVGGDVYYSARGSATYMLEDGIFSGKRPHVYFQDYSPQPYPQVGGGEFEPRLSVVDALFSMGPNATASHVRGTKRWLGYDEVCTR